MAYATVSTGFKSGGFFTSVSPGNEFEPERITAYTVGVRNRLLDNRVQLNLESFYWKYKNNQQSHIGFDEFGNIAFVTNNAGDARLWGFSGDLVVRPSTDDTISINGEYNNTKFSNFTYVVPFFFNGASTGCSLGPISGIRRTVDCSGFPLPRAPRLTGRASYEHLFRFADRGDVRLALTGVYSSSKYLTIDYLQAGKQGQVFTGDVDATFEPAGRRYSVTAFVHNVTNRAVYTGGSEHQQIAGFFYANINPPRTVGIRGQVNF
jgi:iron complex outermembrane receptor protein